jgi:hypothetical protein
MGDETAEAMVLAILRAIKEDVAMIKGENADMRRRLIAIEARLDRQERRAYAHSDARLARREE